MRVATVEQSCKIAAYFSFRFSRPVSHSSQHTPATTTAAEESRQQALLSYGILDTKAEPEFDDIVRLARRLCDTPVALVSLVDGDRQWFKAREGFEPCETPLDQSVCKYALALSDLLVIHDLELDARTRNNTLVTEEPHIRFYAGAPLITPDGYALGTICVIDKVPRAEGLTQDQADDLRALARQVMALLTMRKAVKKRDELVGELRISQRMATDDQLRLTAMFEQAPNFMAMLRGPDHVFEVANPAYMKLVGKRDLVGRSVAEALPDATAQGFTTILDKVYRTGEPYFAEEALYAVQVSPDNPPNDRYLDFVYQPVTDADNKVAGIFVEGSDVTDRVRQAQRLTALADLGEHLRRLTTVHEIVHAATACLAEGVRASRTGFGTVDIADETITVPIDWCAPGVASVAGSHAFRSFGSYVDDLKQGRTVAIEDVENDPRTQDDATKLVSINVKAILNLPVMDQGRLALVVFVHQDTVHPWTESELLFVRQIGDRTQLAIEHLKSEQHQKVLNQELDHRLKNTLAMVQAIAKQTLKSVTERDAVDAFTQRIGALARAHEVLLKQSWSSARMQDVAAGVLATFERADRFVLEGPNLTIGPRAALSLSLLLHELATNAIKYGSISSQEGLVTVEWSVIKQDNESDPQVVLNWLESGGPPAVEPVKRGFGSRLIKMGLIGTGGVDLRYASTGFSASMKAPLSQMQQS